VTYQALYRRYRPRRFAELKGQEHIVRALRNAVTQDRVGHAYLFSGPRGTGKTTSARILAKVLNCEHPLDGEPCCACESCTAVEAGLSYDVIELDAASNNGVDDVRELIERAALGIAGRRKVYILDEVHMLSRNAEAALLKTLEEPPPHVVFVLATTDPQKVSETIRSRTQHLQFHLLPGDELEQHVRWVIDDAGLEVTDDAVEAVLRRGGGSARDTLSALEQVVTAGGVAPEDAPLDEIVEALGARDAAAALAGLARAVDAGVDPRSAAERLVAHLRDLLLVKLAPELVRLPDRSRSRVEAQAAAFGPAAVTRAMEILGETIVELPRAPEPRILVDVALVRISAVEADTSTGALLARIERLERALAGGVPATPATPASSTAARSTTPTAVPTAVPTGPTTGPAVGTTRVASAGRPDPDPGRPRAVLGSRGRPEASPRTSNEPPAVAPAAPTPPPEPARTAGPIGREQLERLWTDKVIPGLKPVARALYSDARIVDSAAGSATLAVPASVLSRCEEIRPQIEAVLGGALGAAVRLALVADPTGENPPARARRNEPAPPPDDEHYDPAELVDAPPAAMRRTGVDRLLDAFPGAQLVEGAERP
jgi:DNA polymerase-3 subunit gamma/tau